MIPFFALNVVWKVPRGSRKCGEGQKGAKGCQQISVSEFWELEMEVLEIR